MLLGLPEFDFVSTQTVAETCALLSKYGGEARVFAGGTDLLVKMKHKRVLPRYLINIKRIPGLDRIEYEDSNGLRMGALTKIQSIKDSPVIKNKYPVLHEAAAKLGTTQIRNLGTLGGNLANASPSADCAVALLVLGAAVKCMGCRGERVIALEHFFLGPGRTALAEDEIITEIYVPNPPVPSEGIYLKHSLRIMDVAIAGAAILVSVEGMVCREARIALGAVAPTPMRAKKAEELMRGQPADKQGGEELWEKVAAVAAEECLPITDIRGHAAYRKKIIQKLVSQGLEEVITRARRPERTRA